jgi:hypothetical protein
MSQGKSTAGIGSPAVLRGAYMPGIVFIVAAGVFAMGIAVGIVAVVCYGIRREQKRFRRERHYREEHGTPAGPEWPEYFLTVEGLDAVSRGVRWLNGLYIRRVPAAARDDTDTDFDAPIPSR